MKIEQYELISRIIEAGLRSSDQSILGLCQRFQAYGKPVLYLCGGINGLTDSECNDWRSYVKENLGNLYDYLDPMRRDYRGREKECWADIVDGDKKDIAQCTHILVNASKPNWGTGMETILGWGFKKKILVVCPNEKPSPWLIYHANNGVFRTIDAAISELRRLVDA